MSKLDQLPDISDHVLSGLRADDALKHRICQKAARTDSGFSSIGSRRPLIALCALSVVMIAVFVFLGQIRHLSSEQAVPQEQTSSFQTISAGEYRNESPVNLGDIIDETPEEEISSSEDSAPESVEEAYENEVENKSLP